MAPTPTTVDLGGDVTLIVGSKEEQVYLRVSKALLSFASKYFNALFSRNFSEGSAATHGHDITLEGDQANAVTNLFTILHMRCEGPQPMEPGDLVQLGIVADKYDCVKALRLTLDSLFPPFSVSLHSRAVRELVVAAILLDNAKSFNDLTKGILMNYTGSFVEVGAKEIGKRVPMSAWAMLERRRSQFMSDFMGILSNLMMRPCNNSICSDAGMVTHND